MGKRARPRGGDIPADIDFSNGTRGKFVKPGTTLKLPAYLDPHVEVYLTVRTAARDIDVHHLVNDLLKKVIKCIEAA